MLRKLLFITTLVVLAGMSYMAWPFISAFQLKQAIRNGDLALIERKVDWPALRISLRASMLEHAGVIDGRRPVRRAELPSSVPPGAMMMGRPPAGNARPSGLPGSAARFNERRHTSGFTYPRQATPETDKPKRRIPFFSGMWRRIKASVTRRLAPRVIETTLNRMMTPAGLARAYWAREKYRHKLRPAVGFAKPGRAFDGTWLEGTKVARFADSFERVQKVVFTSLTSVEIQIADRYKPDRHYVTVMELQGFDWKLAGLRILKI